MHDGVAEVGKWLRSVVVGHNRYYGVPTNLPSLGSFRYHVGRYWYRTLRRRSQKTRLTWERMFACSTAGYPGHSFITLILCVALASSPKARAGCVNCARPDPWRGWPVMVISTPTLRIHSA